MNRDDIIRMAGEAGFIAPAMSSSFLRHLEHFAALVAAAEREACAKVCYRHAAFIVDPIDKERINQCAAAIRARSNT